MKSKFFLLFTIYYMFVVDKPSANDIGKYVNLDTIINLGVEVDFRDYFPESFKSVIHKEELWTYIPDYENNDTFILLNVKLQTYEIDTIQVFYPSMALKTGSPRIKDISTNDEYLVLLFHSLIAIFEKKGVEDWTYQRSVPLSQPFNWVRLMNNGKLILARAYNVHPRSARKKTKLITYDLKSGGIINDYTPDFEGIEFSHFSPYLWFDAYESQILFSQTTSYEINLMTPSFDIITKISEDKSDWNLIDLKTLQEVSKIGEQNPREIISTLEPYEDVVSRVEAVYFLNNERILVRYIPADNKAKGRARKYDIFSYNKVKGKWNLTLSDLSESPNDTNEIVNKQNFPVRSQYYLTYFRENYYVKLQPKSKINPIGLTEKDYKAKNDDAMRHELPEIHLFIFKTNFEQ